MNKSTGSPARCSVMTWMGGWGWSGREAQQGEDVCIHIADSLHCTAKTNNTVKQLYSNKKEKRELFWSKKAGKGKKKKKRIFL